MRKLGISFILSLCLLDIFAQNTAPRLTSIQNKEFFVHYVVEGNTIFQIAAAYNCNVEDVFEYNPGSERGISVGDTLLLLAQRTTLKHKVKAKETLYSISKLYYTTVDELIKNNQGCENGIQINQMLTILNGISPLKSIPNDTSVNTEEKSENKENTDVTLGFENHKINDSILKYKIQKGETLYSISKRYRINKSELINLNKLTSNTLSEGQILLIPLHKEKKIDSLSREKFIPRKDSILSWKIVKKEMYNVVICLPLSLDSSSSKSLQYTLAATDFYMGSKLALDSLERNDFHANVAFLDYLNSKENLTDQLSQYSKEPIDLLIAPWDSSYYTTLKDWSIENQVMTVYPSPCSYSILFNNPFALSYATFEEQLIEDLGKDCGNSRFKSVLIQSDSSSNHYYEGVFKKSYYEGKNRYNLLESNFKNFKKFIKPTDTVNIILLSEDEKFILKIWGEVKEMENIRLFGLESWKEMDKISKNAKNPVHYYFHGKNDFEYKEQSIKNLNKHFRNNYQCDLTYFSCFGFDITLNTIHTLLLNEPSQFGSMSQLSPLQRLIGHGFENSHSYLLEYKDFRTYRFTNE